MNKYELHLGDCLEVMKSIPAGSVDMVLCDLPYGTTACKWDSVIPFEPLWEQYRRITKPNAAIVLTASQPFTTALIASNLNEFKYCWVWNKGVGVNFLHVKRQPLKVTEDVCVFYCKQPTYKPQKTAREKPIKKSNNNVGESSGFTVDGNNEKYVGRIYEDAYPTVLLNFSSRSSGSRGLHPTQKPVPLMEYLIKTYTNEGDVVMDNCMGSGTTGVACMNTGRRFIGIEMDAGYFQIAQNRIMEASAAAEQPATSD